MFVSGYAVITYSRAAAAERNKELGGGRGGCGENKIGDSILPPPPIANKQ